MRKNITILLMSLIFISCKAQSFKVKNLSNNFELNYIFANIWTGNLIKKEIYNGGLYIKVFKMSDSKATPKDLFDGSDEILESLIISSIPDGDYYTSSELFKIEGLYDPVIIEILSSTYPKFTIKIEHGFKDNRTTETIELGESN